MRLLPISVNNNINRPAFGKVTVVCDKDYANSMNSVLACGSGFADLQQLYEALDDKVRGDVVLKFDEPQSVFKKKDNSARSSDLLEVKILGHVSSEDDSVPFCTVITKGPEIRLNQDCFVSSKTKDATACAKEYGAKSAFLKEYTDSAHQRVFDAILKASKAL